MTKEVIELKITALENKIADLNNQINILESILANFDEGENALDNEEREWIEEENEE